MWVNPGIDVRMGIEYEDRIRSNRADHTGREWIMTGSAAQRPSPQGSQSSVTAADVMRPALTTVEPHAHLAAAAYLMKHAHATSLVVVDGEHASRPVGLITEADVVHAVADGKDVNDVRIEDVMTTGPKVIPATTTIRDAARSMIAGHLHHLPVVDGEGLVGMVDIGDICGALLDPPALASSSRSG
jgi:CBS domain-containing protein